MNKVFWLNSEVHRSLKVKAAEFEMTMEHLGNLILDDRLKDEPSLANLIDSNTVSRANRRRPTNKH